MLGSQHTIDDERLGQEATLHVDVTHIRRHLIHTFRGDHVAELETLPNIHPLVLLPDLLQYLILFGEEKCLAELHGRLTLQLVDLLLELIIWLDHMRLKLFLRVDALLDPLGNLRRDALVCTQMQAPQCLAPPEQTGHIDDSLRAHPSVVQIQSNQVQVVLYEVFYALHDLLILRRQSP